MDKSKVASAQSTQGIQSARQITYYSQVILVYIVVIACIVNLTLGTNDSTWWSSLLSACLGFILPAPKLKSPK